MELKEMTVEQLEERKAAIGAELDNEGADLDALENEVRAIKAELEARKEEEAKKAEVREAVALGEGEVIKTFVEEKRTMEKNFSVDSVEYRDAWIKNLMGKELSVEERTAITGTDAIPTETLDKIVNVLKENALLGKIDLMQIPGYVKIPIYATNNDATWTDSSTDSQDVIGSITLQPKQLIKTIEVPATVDKMSISAFERYITEALANKIESALQKAVIAGTGTTEPVGIITAATSKTGTFTKAAVTKADLLAEMGDLPAEYQNGACWIMPSKVFFSEVMAIADHTDFTNVNDGFTYRLFGKDVVFDDNAKVSNKDVILYGQPKAYHVNLGEGVKVDKDMSVGFRNNSAVYRGVCLADGNLDNSNAFVKYTRATS
jgi:HK97 family phage major capsid protein